MVKFNLSLSKLKKNGFLFLLNLLQENVKFQI